MKSLNICLLNAGFATSLTTPEQLLDRYWHVPRLAEALVAIGHHVTVLQAFHNDESLQLGKVSVEFVAAGRSQREGWAEFDRFADFKTRLARCDFDVVHFFGMTMLPLRRALGDWCKTYGIALTASFHGGQPSRKPVGWWRQHRGFAGTSAFFFPSNTTANQWRKSYLLPRKAQVTIVPEVSSPFSGLPKETAREKFGVKGGPVFAWAGHLNANKDPITALKGVQQIAARWPETQLLMAYQTANLLPEINAFLEQHPTLMRNVKLLGALEHSDMEALLSAADFFIHSSRREWGSNVLVEAMSCSAIPVVSNIPSLRTLTRQIDPAVVFDIGDYKSLARQVLAISIDDIDRSSRQVQSLFIDHLSYPVLAAKLGKVFESSALTSKAKAQR